MTRLGTRLALAAAVVGCGCGAETRGGRPSGDGGDGNGGGGGGGGGGGVGGGGGGESGPADDPRTCEEAATRHSYVGCDYWPVSLPNIVRDLYDFAVVVANAGDEPADVTVTGGSLGAAASVVVPPKELRRVFLPWVGALKNTWASMKVKNGAFHLVSTRPVTVYQFNPLEYKAAGGPPGKIWGACPGGAGCHSFTNDASLLIPSTAMTGNYRVTGHPGDENTGPYFNVTATRDDTLVKVTMGAGARVELAPMSTGDIPPTPAGGTFTITLQAGDSLNVFAPARMASDLSGALVDASKPVQVMHGIPCTFMPKGTASCDHIEETVLPSETLGKHYLVNVSTAPIGKPVGHVVRLYGAHDGTDLGYQPAPPAGAPAVLNAGEFADLGIVTEDFEVKGSMPFAVGSFMLGAVKLNAGTTLNRGDPAQSVFAAVEQFRKLYIFLTPDDYDMSYADVVAPDGATLEMDGAPVGVTGTAIGATGWNIFRILLGPGVGGAHTLRSDRGVGLQVIGYGYATSYQFPGGLNLRRIATTSGR